MKASSCPNLNRETTSFPNFHTLYQDPDHHDDTTLNKRPKIDNSQDTEASETSPFKDILSPFVSFNEMNDSETSPSLFAHGHTSKASYVNLVSLIFACLFVFLFFVDGYCHNYKQYLGGSFYGWDEMNLPRWPPSPNGSDTNVSVGSNEDLFAEDDELDEKVDDSINNFEQQSKSALFFFLFFPIFKKYFQKKSFLFQSFLTFLSLLNTLLFSFFSLYLSYHYLIIFIFKNSTKHYLKNYFQNTSKHRHYGKAKPIKRRRGFVRSYRGWIRFEVQGDVCKHNLNHKSGHNLCPEWFDI